MGGKKRNAGFNRPFADLAKLAPPPAAKPLAKPLAKASAPAPVRPMDDETLFQSEVTGVTPLAPAARSPRVGTPPAPVTRRAPKSDDVEVLAELADLCGGDGPFDISDSDEYIEGLADGIDRRILKRLRAGEFALQGPHCDLHGMTKEQARDRVARFLADARRESRRCVLIVHGRGQHSKDQIPVLKTAVKSWLERGAMARSVLAFATARPHDGGTGAVYVLLRK